jgi:sugar phosphate isomerase/epimerase
MVRTAIQLHTLRSIDESLPDLVSRVGETTFDGIELWDQQFDYLAAETARERTAASVTEAGLEVPGAHVSVERIESDPELVAEICDSLNCSRVVVPTYDGDAFTDRASIEATADHLADLAASVGECELLYHNHDFEFGDVDGEAAIEILATSAEGRFEFEPDVGLATHTGYDASELLSVVNGHAPLVHLTDSDPTNPESGHADPGDGVVDLEQLAGQAVDNGADWLVCENGGSTDPVRTLERGSDTFERLRETVSRE